MEEKKRFSELTEEEWRVISLNIIRAIYSYLQLFVSAIVARRIISAILIIAGARNANITELTGLSERGIRNLKNELATENMASFFEVKSGRGRKPKFKDIESQIIEELEKGNYQTLKQIADMVHEKFGVSASVMAVWRLLKKTGFAS